MDERHPRRVGAVPALLLRLTRDTRQLRLLAILVQRVWPISVAAYLVMIVASPKELPLYSIGPTWISPVCFTSTAVLLLAATVWPRCAAVTASAMAAVTWSFMGRAIAYAFDAQPAWSRAIGSSAYVLLTIAEVVVALVHAVLVVEQQVRGDGDHA